MSLDLKALKTLRDRAVLSFDHALSTTGRAGPNDLKTVSTHVGTGPGNFYILRHIFLASETRSRPLQKRPRKHRYVFNPRTNFDHGTEFGKATKQFFIKIR